MTLPRTTGCRWHRWKNISAFDAPPFACVTLQGVLTSDNSEIIFTGGTELVATPPLENLGVQRYAAFNSEKVVAPGGTGEITFDLPAWTIIQENVELMGFATISALSQRWSLGPIPDGNTLPEEYYSGFRVFATRYFPEWVAIWEEKQPEFLVGNFRIGLVGGLTTYLTDFTNIES